MNDDSFSLLSERFNTEPTPETDAPAEEEAQMQAQADDSFALIAPQAPEI